MTKREIQARIARNIKLAMTNQFGVLTPMQQAFLRVS